jgi:SAM-dependent methyltransferase
MVGASGRVVAIERDEQALATARGLLAQSPGANVELRAGEATATGIEPGSVDVVMLRHVLAHNGGHEQAIVDHLATLLRPSGCAYLVDVDLTGMRVVGADPELDDLSDKYVSFHKARGNDPSIGLQLGGLARSAGLELASFVGVYNILEAPPGMRPPASAAYAAMVAEGAAQPADIERWEAAFTRTDAAATRPQMFAPVFIAIGRKAAS